MARAKDFSIGGWEGDAGRRVGPPTYLSVSAVPVEVKSFNLNYFSVDIRKYDTSRKVDLSKICKKVFLYKFTSVRIFTASKHFSGQHHTATITSIIHLDRRYF